MGWCRWVWVGVGGCGWVWVGVGGCGWRRERGLIHALFKFHDFFKYWSIVWLSSKARRWLDEAVMRMKTKKMTWMRMRSNGCC